MKCTHVPLENMSDACMMSYVVDSSVKDALSTYLPPAPQIHYDNADPSCYKVLMDHFVALSQIAFVMFSKQPIYIESGCHDQDNQLVKRIPSWDDR